MIFDVMKAVDKTERSPSPSPSPSLSSIGLRSFYDKIPKISKPTLDEIGDGSDSSETSEICRGDADESSESSSALSWADEEATDRVVEEWNRIERTLYDERGPGVRSAVLIDECRQWKAFFPHLRIRGKRMDTHRTEDRFSSKNGRFPRISLSDRVDVDLPSTSGNLIREFENDLRLTPGTLSDERAHRSILKSEMLSFRWRKGDAPSNRELDVDGHSGYSRTKERDRIESTKVLRSAMKNEKKRSPSAVTVASGTLLPPISANKNHKINNNAPKRITGKDKSIGLDFKFNLPLKSFNLVGNQMYSVKADRK